VRELPVLDATDQRILGSLLEKQTTVPATYPLSANALVSACNQTSSRDPVTDLDRQTVERTAKSLKERGLLRIVWSDTGRRVLKYHQILDELLGLDPDERALLTVLLLRGPQLIGWGNRPRGSTDLHNYFLRKHFQLLRPAAWDWRLSHQIAPCSRKWPPHESARSYLSFTASRGGILPSAVFHSA